MNLVQIILLVNFRQTTQLRTMLPYYQTRISSNEYRTPKELL